MKIIRTLIFLFILTYATTNSLAQDGEMAPSFIMNDYTELAQTITQGAKSPYDKCKAIYKWITENITYDPNSIANTADFCYNMKKGTSNGFCDLFYHLANTVGVSSSIVTGNLKDFKGMSKGIHMWIAADVGRKAPILIDPTLGAGFLKNKTFVRSTNMQWFDVDPYKMIFTHLPHALRFQMVDDQVLYSQFEALTAFEPSMFSNGMKASEVLSKSLNGSFEVPNIYSGFDNFLRLREMPLTKKLHIGTTYTFEVEKLADNEIYIVNNVIDPTKTWKCDGKICRIAFMPTRAGKLTLCVKTNGKYAVVLAYEVPTASQQELTKAANADPYSLPEVQSRVNVNRALLEKHGVDGKKLIALINSGVVGDTLPIINPAEGLDFTIVDVPMTYHLKPNKSYRFCIKPMAGAQYAVVANGRIWFKDWQTNSDGSIWLNATTPPSGASMSLFIKPAGAKSFMSCMSYTLK
ncbi:MAG: hypothetical protein IKR17_10060 [Bacteroidales bacterium]|nr:hypothetical protein [Bacteroidales bacterium]